MITTRWIIGLASGSSADGVDAALLEVEGLGLELKVRLVHFLHQPYGRDLRELIVRLGRPGSVETKQLCLLHRLLGETFAAAARQVADRASFSLPKVQCIGCPGHTVWHDPDGRFPSTLALGMAAIVAERTGVTVVSDFRSRDLAAGGQGVPLAALADYLLFRHPQENRLLLHLGGLARVVYLPAGGRIPDVLGFEAGPCNGLLNALMRQLTGGRETYDPGGKHAVQGRCIEALLRRWLSDPYLQRRPPKSLPRHHYGEEFAFQAVQQSRQAGCNLHDLLCTATHFVAHGITEAVRRFLPPLGPGDRVLLSGGGVRNGLLWHLLEQQLAGATLERTDGHGIPAEARKPVNFGILAALTVDGVPANVPSATGAAGSRLVGSLTPGSTANWARCLAWMAAAQPAPPSAEGTR
ncbi:MAG TPA: anhydro-N-acetylmuramic acid kinase [Gemmataceae bacterium]|nr:anhydro-N-acetylmuramic acid kinase [Gemmataceae bacterium]